MSVIHPGSADQTRLIEGRGSYVSDLVLADALWLHVVRSDIAHGTLQGLDLETLRGVPGVVAILSGEDLKPMPRIPIRVGATPALEAHLQPVLATDRVRYVGEPVAIVVAETPEIAEEAASQAFADLTPLEPVTGVDAPASLWDDLQHNVLIEETAGEGDLEAVFAAAKEIVRLELSTARRTGVPIELRGMMAVWEEGVLHTWGATKFVHFTRRVLADLFAIEPGRVVCHRVDVGGMFGVRGEFYPEDFLVPWAAKVTGRPVRWQEHRRDHLATINHAGEQQHRIEIAVSPDGRLSGLRSGVTLDMGAYPRPIGNRIAEIILGMVPGPYAWDAYEVRFKAVCTSKAPTGTVRGPAALETTFVRERAVDVAARKAGQDPLQLRRRSLIPPGQIPYRRSMGEPGHDVVFDSGDFIGVFEGMLERAGYADWVAERGRRRAAGEHVGIGSGVFILHSGLGGEETLTVELETDGRFLIRTSASEVGQGLDAMARRALAWTLGVPESEIGIWSGDTQAHEGGAGTYASRSTVFIANALVDAADRLRSRAAEGGARLLRCAADDVTFNAVGPARGTEQLRWKDVAPIEVVGRFEMREPTYGFGAHLALVSVDIETGDVIPERMAIAYDCGRALDRQNVVDQIVGAAAMGVGAALHERFIYDPSGNPVSSNLSDYLIPTGTDLPSMDVFVFESAPAGGNPLGVKGVGEAGIVGVGAAIANAVVDALGSGGDAVVTRLPIDRQSIAMHHAGGRSAG